MNEIIEEENLEENKKIELAPKVSEITYINYYYFDIKYEVLSPIIKDFQMSSQLIKFIKRHQMSDLVFIAGNNSYSIGSRFYFNFRNIIDVYLKGVDFIESDYFTRMSYYVYKTKPSSKEFKVNISLFYNDENSSKLYVEIVFFNNTTLNKQVLNIIYSEINQILLYLTNAIKINKMESFSFCSSIIGNEFLILSQIVQNVKLIEYIINGRLTKFQRGRLNNKIDDEMNAEILNNDDIDIELKNNTINENKAFIHEKEKFTVKLKKKNDLNDWMNVNKLYFQIILIKKKEESIIIEFKAIFNNNDNGDKDSIYNVITVCINKLTTNSSFVLIKYTWDCDIDKDLLASIKYFYNKCLHNIEKLSLIAKKY